VYDGFNVSTGAHPANVAFIHGLMVAAASGDMQAREQLLSRANLSGAGHSDKMRLAKSLIALININKAADADLGMAIEELGLCDGVDCVSDYLTTFAVDSTNPCSFRQMAVVRLGQFVAPNELRRFHPEQYVPNRSVVSVLRAYIMSKNPSDRRAAVEAIDIGRIAGLRLELTNLRSRERNNDVLAAVDSALSRDN
jgi:hypothetical protein